MTTVTHVSRRGFLAAASGLVLGFALPERSKLGAQQVGIPPPNLFAPPPTGKPMSYIHIGTDTSESDEYVMEADRAWYTCDKGSVQS